MPEPPESVKEWPLVGDAGLPVLGARLDQSSGGAGQDRSAAASRSAAACWRLRPDAGTGAIQFLIGVIVAGFLFSPAPALVDDINRFSRRLASEQGETFVQIAGATIRAVARGVIGVAALQAFLVGIGLVVAGIPAASLITAVALVLGIIQIGPAPWSSR